MFYSLLWKQQPITNGHDSCMELLHWLWHLWSPTCKTQFMVLFFSKAKSRVESYAEGQQKPNEPSDLCVLRWGKIHTVWYSRLLYSPNLPPIFCFVLRHLIESHTLQEIPVRPDAVIVLEIFSCHAAFIQFSQDVRCFVWRYALLFWTLHLFVMSVYSAAPQLCPRAHVITTWRSLVLIDLSMIQWHESNTLCPPNHNKGISALSAQWYGRRKTNKQPSS